MAQQAEQQFRKLQVMGSNPIIGSIFGVWRSLVARFVRDEEVAGSNPVTPTNENLNQSKKKMADGISAAIDNGINYFNLVPSKKASFFTAVRFVILDFPHIVTELQGRS